METLYLNPNGNPTKSAAFLIMYSVDGRPWANYSNASDAQRELVVPQVLAVGRSDGLLGFVGGMLESINAESDTLEEVEDALKREVLEEVGFELEHDPEPLIRVKGPRLDKFVFVQELPHSSLQTVAREAHHAQHFGSEITGTLMLQIADYEDLTGRNYGGLQNVLRLPFAGNAAHELAQLIVKKQLMPVDSFERACEKAGYNASYFLGNSRLTNDHPKPDH